MTTTFTQNTTKYCDGETIKIVKTLKFPKYKVMQRFSEFKKTHSDSKAVIQDGLHEAFASSMTKFFREQLGFFCGDDVYEQILKIIK